MPATAVDDTHAFISFRCPGTRSRNLSKIHNIGLSTMRCTAGIIHLPFIQIQVRFLTKGLVTKKLKSKVRDELKAEIQNLKVGLL